MILLIDNYDSFSYNLVQMAGSLNPDIRIIRNDEMTVEEIREMSPSHIILSPGPGYPKAAGVCEDVAKQLSGAIPILGVCLGHQGICEAFGAEITHARKLMHGKQSLLTIDASDPIFHGLPGQILAARYHSLIAAKDSLPNCLTVIGTDDMGEIMAVKHKDYPLYGLQFHPESILTPNGITILENFLSIHIKEAD
ncbi:aminodeoxychorismate/anthranilate synthase component II [Lacrimispora sp. BS-2]|uniref:Aminodeoxychorismate/anthranilate synthase component II n=1 Tax=Lacrimispora sp. BS-2 TaxID=3151850 RepID=A0AAU7PP09_9FIRM